MSGRRRKPSDAPTPPPPAQFPTDSYSQLSHQAPAATAPSSSAAEVSEQRGQQSRADAGAQSTAALGLKRLRSIDAIRSSSDLVRQMIQTDFWRDFKTFIVQTRVLETGVGVIIGRAFQDMVRSFVNDVMVPPLTLYLFGDNIINFFILLKLGKSGRIPRTLDEAQTDGATTIRIGKFVRQLINFLTVGIAVYWLLGSLKRFFQWKLDLQQTKRCTFCQMDIHHRAVRCPHCTSHLATDEALSESTPITVEKP
ncbi:uncharacterized protein BJ171DRAFT_191966 [Polychytrium aggregatum]|uniref:uncharacterized protein n=1 Tax=Polychytrium aggregatum TaxID=110093 RepID=UPI0022FDD8BD|nr:uncharacterized protein BJ171DRAFT_191966 [Polychytrium aggregatum]KAI9202138.1 hypothetical protein BJ171DRAFT_191966 [Polychytrium aggregatum]